MQSMLCFGMVSNPREAEEEMHHRIFGGARLLLDSLNAEELVALQPMLFSGEAEIINEACNAANAGKVRVVAIAHPIHEGRLWVRKRTSRGIPECLVWMAPALQAQIQ
jgi:hypothetical protein